MSAGKNFLIQGLSGGPPQVGPDGKIIIESSVIDGSPNAVSGGAVADELDLMDARVRDLIDNISVEIVYSPQMTEALDNKVPDTVKQEVVYATEKMPDSRITYGEINALFDI